jgi:hypothetical protein
MKIKIFLVLFMFSTNPAMAAFTAFPVSKHRQAQQDEWQLQEEKRMQLQRQQQWQLMQDFNQSQNQLIQQQQHDELIRTLNKFHQ